MTENDQINYWPYKAATTHPVFPTNVRKCPRHKAWIQNMQGGKNPLRFCPRCDLEVAQYNNHIQKQEEAAGIVKPILRTMKI